MQVVFLAILILGVTTSLYGVTKVKTFTVDGQKLKLEEVAKVGGIPWGFTFLTADSMLVTLRGGGIRLVRIKEGKVRSLNNPLSVVAQGQGGLLDIVKDPNFKNTKKLYVSYSSGSSSRPTVYLSQLRYGNELRLEKHLLKAKADTSTGVHFGSRLAIHRGFIYMTIGDRGRRHKAQSLASHQGKILRLKLDGSVPRNNPFVGQKGALPEIWSYGHRNPQGLYITSRGKVWAMEHGPKGGDELNLIKPGRNYGWPKITYGKEYSGGYIAPSKGAGMEQPVKYYVPSIAPCGLTGYQGSRLKIFRNSLFAGALKATHLNRLVLEGTSVVGEERLFEELQERIRHVKEGPDGRLYFSTDTGRVLRITD